MKNCMVELIVTKAIIVEAESGKAAFIEAIDRVEKEMPGLGMRANRITITDEEFNRNPIDWSKQ